MQGEFAGPQQLAASQQDRHEATTAAEGKVATGVAQLQAFAASYAVLGHSSAAS
jgi:hypothetical protein